MVSQPRQLFVGRQQEMVELRSAVEETIAGRGRLAMLVGEPGIGKTRTAQELATHAETRGAQALWGRCYEDEGAPPYWPWVQAIRSYAQTRSLDQLQVEMGPSAADIAEIVPEIRRKLPDLEMPPELPPEQARFRLFDSITSFFKIAASSQPLILVLDDLHWADEPSLLLLQFLAQQLSDSCILVLGCYRDVELSRQHPLSESLARLSSEAHYQRYALRRLDLDDTARFVDAAVGANVSRNIVEAIYSRTEGNPFFTTEVIQLLSDRGELADDAESGPQGIRIPEGVREVIGQRLNRLSADCNLVLSTAAVIGREFTVNLLDRLIEDLTEDKMLRVLEEALAAHLIEEPSVGNYQFNHALIQETLTAELSLTRRVRLHARIAETLESIYSSQVEAHAAELAYHFAQAEAVTGAEKVVQYSLMAGDGAVKVRAYEEALAHFQRGLMAKGIKLDGLEPAEDAEAAALLSGLGSAQMGTQDRANRGLEADSLGRAFNYYVNARDTERAVITALSAQLGSSRGLIESALTLVSPDSQDAGRLHARHILTLRADYEKSQDAFHHALSIAREQQDKVLEMQSLVAAACVDLTSSHFERSLERNQQALELAKLVDLPTEEAHAHFDLQHVLYAMGDLEGATRHAEAMLEPAKRTRARIWQDRAMDSNHIVSSAKGDWPTAQKYIEQGLATSPQDFLLIGAGAVMEYQLGETDAGEEYLKRLLDYIPEDGADLGGTFAQLKAVVIPLAAYITGGMAEFDVVEGVAQSIISSPESAPSHANAARIGLALIAVLRRDMTAASELYAALHPILGTMAPQSNYGPGLAVDRVLGLLCQTMGNLDQATGHFEDALTFCRKGGYRPELAWTCCDYADTLSQRRGAGDHEKASALLDESLLISTELGMRPLMERAAARRENMESRPDTPAAYPDGLTHREVEVLCLLAQGRSNSQISEELVVAEGTTRRHVANIYEKINVANRAEATRYALRERLVSLDEAQDETSSL